MKIRIHKDSIIFGFCLMFCIGVFFSELFYRILSCFTAVKAKFFGGSAEELKAKLASDTAKIEDVKRQNLSGKTWEEKMLIIWNSQLRSNFKASYKTNFEKYDLVPNHYDLFFQAVELGLKNYIAFVQPYTLSEEKTKQWEKNSASDNLKLACNFAMDSGGPFTSLKSAIFNDLRDKNYQYILGENSGFLSFRQNALNGDYTALNTLLSELIKNALVKINKLYSNKGLTLF